MKNTCRDAAGWNSKARGVALTIMKIRAAENWKKTACVAFESFEIVREPRYSCRRRSYYPSHNLLA